MTISAVEREFIDLAVALRALSRGELCISPDNLNEYAARLVELQREWAQQREDMEKLVSCVEQYILSTQSLTIEASNVVQRYRKSNPKTH
jgi:hypothetical protein